MQDTIMLTFYRVHILLLSVNNIVNGRYNWTHILHAVSMTCCVLQRCPPVAVGQARFFQWPQSPMLVASSPRVDAVRRCLACGGMRAVPGPCEHLSSYQCTGLSHLALLFWEGMLRHCGGSSSSPRPIVMGERGSLLVKRSCRSRMLGELIPHEIPHVLCIP